MKPWHTMFREADGSVSATRVALLLTVFNVNAMWDVSCFLGKPLSIIPPSVCVFVSVLAGLKWGQIKHESDGPACPPEPPASLTSGGVGDATP